MDQGWALVNAVLLAFNHCNMQNYLNWAYLILIEKRVDLDLIKKMKVKIYLCATHFLKSMIKNIKTVNIHKNVRRTFIYVFTLIQNADTMEKIDLYLINIHNLFMNKHFDDSVKYSLDFLTTELKNRNLPDIDNERNLPEEKERDILHEDFIKESNIFFVVDFEKQVRNESPLNNYYNDKLEYYDTILQQRFESNIKFENPLIANPYYAPKAFEKLKRVLYMVPLWTWVMMREINSFGNYFAFLTHLTNNYVESHFCQVKKRILNKRKKLYSSEIAGPFYRRLLAQYCEHYNESGLLSLYKRNEAKKAILDDIWKDKQKHSGREKGIYYKNVDLLKLSEEQKQPFLHAKLELFFDPIINAKKLFGEDSSKLVNLNNLFENELYEERKKSYPDENEVLMRAEENSDIKIKSNDEMLFFSESDENNPLKNEEMNASENFTSNEEVNDILDWFISYETPNDQLTNSLQPIENKEKEIRESYLQCAEVLDMLEKEFLPFIQQENISISLVKKKFLDYRDYLSLCLL